MSGLTPPSKKIKGQANSIVEHNWLGFFHHSSEASVSDDLAWIIQGAYLRCAKIVNRYGEDHNCEALTDEIFRQILAEAYDQVKEPTS